ncbi:MAG: T9SS type A sorting domain-containing protein [bacterium]|nr:MAG: T9SS type A sorting domain-containing protein [bacterium]
MSSHQIYGTWVFTDTIHNYSPGPLQHITGQWSDIKAVFCGSSLGSSYDGLHDGEREPRSSEFNRLCWNAFADTMQTYTILRRTDSDEEYSTIGFRDFNDTIYIDSTTAAGHEYHYRIISNNTDTLQYTDEISLGLTRISTLAFPDIHDYPSTMLVENGTLYIAADVKLKKIDVSDSYNPFEVGSRDFSWLPKITFDPRIKDIALDAYTNLLVTGHNYFIVIDRNDNALTSLSEKTGFLSDPNSHCTSVAVMGRTAFLGSTEGVVAINYSNPYDPEVWGTYTGIGTSQGMQCMAVERVGEYLYLEFTTNWNVSKSEIVKPMVDEIAKTVYFDVICTDHDPPLCLYPETDLVGRINPLLAVPLRGNPTGYYSVGKTDDSTFAVFDTSDPANPVPFKIFESPWSKFWCDDPIAGGYTLTYERSYAFDGQYVYAALRRSTSNPYSAVYVFDLFSPDSTPVYALGDMEIGNFKNGTVASYGRNLYFFDQVSDSLEYYHLQIFEKSRGCDADVAVSTQLDPNADLYEFGQQATIQWSCTGCPTRIDIKLVEDGTLTRSLGSLLRFDKPDLASNSIQWNVEGISEDYENRTYNIQVLAWNIEGNHDYTYSRAFTIVEELPDPKGGDVPVLGLSGLDGDDRQYPFPGMERMQAGELTHIYWLLPVKPLLHNGLVTLSIEGGERTNLIIHSPQLLAIDAPESYQVAVLENEPVLVGNGSVVSYISSYLQDDPATDHDARDKQVSVSGISCNSSVEQYSLGSGVNLELAFNLPAEDSSRNRYYIFYFKGRLCGRDNEGSGAVPTVFTMEDPYPNPFNATIVLEFHLPRDGVIQLRVYDSAGTCIRTLMDDYCRAGMYRRTWNGRNDSDKIVSSGVYFCKLTIDGAEQITRKVVLLR